MATWGPLQANRLRSIDADLFWNRDGWDANLILNDSAHNGVVDWASKIPGLQKLGSQNINYSLPECLNECLNANSDDWMNAGSEAQSFLSTLEIIDIAKVVNDSNGIPNSWSVVDTNLTSLTTNANSYLNSILTNPNTGDWDLNRVLSSGNTFFGHLCSRITSAQLITDSSDIRFGSIQMFVPMNATNQGLNVYLKPEGTIEIELQSYPLAGSTLSGLLRLDFAGVQPSNSTDGITLYSEIEFGFGFSKFGLFSNSYIRLEYDEMLNLTDRLTVDLHLPGFSKVLSPLNQLDEVDDGNTTWVSSPDSLRLYPPLKLME